MNSEVVREACKGTCADCPGPHDEDGCLTRPFPEVVVGRRWPMCPNGMLRVTSWRALVDLYVASKVSPISGFPEDRPAWVQDGVIALLNAVRVALDEKSASAGDTADKPAGSKTFRPRGRARGA